MKKYSLTFLIKDLLVFNFHRKTRVFSPFIHLTPSQTSLEKRAKHVYESRRVASQ